MKLHDLLNYLDTFYYMNYYETIDILNFSFISISQYLFKPFFIVGNSF